MPVPNETMRTEIGLRRIVNSVSPDRASPVMKRAKHGQVAAIMAELDRTHGSVAPKHKSSGKKLAKTKATGQKAVQDQDKPGPSHGNEIEFCHISPAGAYSQETGRLLESIRRVRCSLRVRRIRSNLFG